MARWFAVLGLLGVLGMSMRATWAALDTDGDGLSDAAEQRIGTLLDVPEDLVLVAESKNEGDSDEQAARNAPDILTLWACHVGGQRLLLKVDFARPPDFTGATFIAYLDLDNNPHTGRQDESHRGVDVMVVVAQDAVSVSLRNPELTERNTSARGAREGSSLYLTLDAPLPAGGDTIPVGVHLLSQRGAGRSDWTPHQVVQLPRSPRVVPDLAPVRSVSLRTVDDYRYHDDLVKYEKLEDKGLRYEQVAPAEPFQAGRPCPEPLFASTAPHPERPGSLVRERVSVSLLEEAGVRRTDSPVSFGFPCPRGGLYDPAHMRLLDAQGNEVPAQFTITSLWPDGSLKWVLVDFTADLAAGQERNYTVELGQEVERSEATSPLSVQEDADRLIITTGPLRAVIDKQRFSLLREVSRVQHGQGGMVPLSEVGMRLLDETGRLFTSSALPPERIGIEQQGPCKVVVRAEGRYGASDGRSLMRYLARITFTAGSSRVAVSWTHINDALATEFTDITALGLDLPVLGDAPRATVLLGNLEGGLKEQDGGSVSLRQWDDATGRLSVDGEEELDVGRAPGVLRVGDDRAALTLAVEDFWQRWPKGLTADGGTATLWLLPPQPGPDFGAGLPGHLLYPFVSGRYRFKWGMAFTERFVLDFDPSASLTELYAEVSQPPVAVLPAIWYATTGAAGPVAAPVGQQFAVWDDWVAASFAAHMAQKERMREYGFFNYGDWYGERGRNWGNNEYDLAHGLFQQFLRTGRRDYYRWALKAARHQADVDIVHAYPDGFYVGGMVPHSVAHTGTWSEALEHGTWHSRYDSMVTAANGHQWADGLTEAWFLNGDPWIMHSALLMGEHITWAMSPTFTHLGTHERSAGWSLRSIMALYRATCDPEYLAAAGRIAAVALREQDLDHSGAWPHELPLDHANGKQGIVGNNLFLIGILLAGLQAYHESTADPAVERSLVAGVRWVARTWDAGIGGWPYSATVDGQPLYPASTGLNMLIIQPIAYVAKLTGDAALWEIVERALASAALGGYQAFGKSLAQQMHFAGGTLAMLQQRYATSRPDGGVGALSGDPGWYATMMARTPDAPRHSVRAPDEKRFFVRLRDPQAELVAVRRPYGAMIKRSPTGTLEVRNGAGDMVGQTSFSTDEPVEYRCAVAGEIGEDLSIVINDDQRGVWDISGKGLSIVMHAGPGFRIGGVGKGKYHLWVPAGVSEFRVNLLGVHTGAYGAVVLSPTGEVAGLHQGANPGTALIPGAAQSGPPVPPSHPERGEIIVRPAPADAGHMWSLVLWAAGDIGVELVGVPPFLSLTEDQWFEPGR